MKRIVKISSSQNNDDNLTGILTFIIVIFLLIVIVKVLFWIGAVIIAFIAGIIGYLVFF